MGYRTFVRGFCTVAIGSQLLLVPRQASAQSVLQRTPNTTGAWVGLPGTLEIDASVRYRSVGDGDLADLPTIGVAYGLKQNFLLGFKLATSSPVGFGRSTEYEPYLRWAPILESADQHLQLALRLDYNSAAASVDGEVEAAYRLSVGRLLGSARFFSNAFDEDAGLGLAGGVIIHPFAGNIPIAVAGDIATAFGPSRGTGVAWAAGLQTGLPSTTSTLSLEVTNSASTTLQGRTLGTGDFRFGAELTVTSPIGELFGVFVPRDVAERAVARVERPPAGVVQVDIRDFAFVGDRLVVPAGTTVRWTNRDSVIHTATSDDAAWNSGAIPEGESWSARFDVPGIYAYHCGPHPYMRGTIVVR